MANANNETRNYDNDAYSAIKTFIALNGILNNNIGKDNLTQYGVSYKDYLNRFYSCKKGLSIENYEEICKDMEFTNIEAYPYNWKGILTRDIRNLYSFYDIRRPWMAQCIMQDDILYCIPWINEINKINDKTIELYAYGIDVSEVPKDRYYEESLQLYLNQYVLKTLLKKIKLECIEDRPFYEPKYKISSTDPSDIV